MVEDRTSGWRMKTMQEVMDLGVREEDIPKNILHLF